MKNEACNYFQKTHTDGVHLVIKLLDPGNSTGVKGTQPAFGRVPVRNFKTELNQTIIEQGAPCFHFVLGNSLSHFYYSCSNPSLKTFRGEGDQGDIPGTMLWKGLGPHDRSCRVEDAGPGVVSEASAE